MNIYFNRALNLILIALTSFSFSAQAANNDGRALAAQCAQCHGTDGYSRTGIDSLAGERDIAEEMREMQNEPDGNDIMVKQAHGYTDTEITLIAQYFASLPKRNTDSSDNNNSLNDNNNYDYFGNDNRDDNSFNYFDNDNDDDDDDNNDDDDDD